MLLIHTKIDCLEVLRVMIQSYNLFDFLPWFETLIKHLFDNSEILESSNLMAESLFTLQKLVENYKFAFSETALNILLIEPNLLNHIMVLIEVIILKANLTVINVNKEKRKPGLMVNENDRSLKNMYANHDVEYLENTLIRYLNFLL